MADPRNLTPEMDLLASELALGLLEGSERLEAERLRLQDPDFAAAVAEWETVGLSWLEEQPGQAPSDLLWHRIEAGLTRSETPIVPVQERYLEPHEIGEPGRGGVFWKVYAIAASLAALAFALMWMLDEPERISVPVEVPVEGPVQPDVLSVAQISQAEAGTLLSALYDRETGKLYLKLAEIPDPSRVPQLWLLDAGGTPRSLGFGNRNSVTELQLSEAQREIVAASGVIAVSLEQPSSTPGDTPTDVLGTAELAPFEGSSPST